MVLKYFTLHLIPIVPPVYVWPALKVIIMQYVASYHLKVNLQFQERSPIHIILLTAIV